MELMSLLRRTLETGHPRPNNVVRHKREFDRLDFKHDSLELGRIETVMCCANHCIRAVYLELRIGINLGIDIHPRLSLVRRAGVS